MTSFPLRLRTTTRWASLGILLAGFLMAFRVWPPQEAEGIQLHLPIVPPTQQLPYTEFNIARESTDNAPEASDAAFLRTQHGPFDPIIRAAALRFGLDPFLLKGLLATESRLEPFRRGKRSYRRVNGRRVLVAGGALGIAQFTAAGISAVNRLRSRRMRASGLSVRLFDAQQALMPDEAILAAAELLAHLMQRFGRNGGITAYNSGATRGKLVKRLGFAKAQESRQLRRHGLNRLQGYRFLPNVLSQANRYRERAGLATLKI